MTTVAKSALTLGPCAALMTTRSDGVVLGFTDHDNPLTFAGVQFEPESGFAASEIRVGSELNVDSQDAEGVLSSDRITEADIVGGHYDNAAVEVWRVNWAAVSQRILMRRGSIGEVRRGKIAFTAEMRSLAHLLDQATGRTYQYSCDAALGDGRCKVNLAGASFNGTGAVTSLIRDRSFRTSGLVSFPAGWFDHGILSWTSGPNAGREAEVVLHGKSGSVVSLSLLEAPVVEIAAGHEFTIVAGCDKRHSTCFAKFSNIANFRGFPHIPGQDAVVRYAKKSGLNDGQPL
ncbi:DUF2163 domain-containing protein [Paracoccus sp. MA]|uniref:DUF2163 domain-containing protein n=1 Tax=Paracoccus sp. MA TaxID=2895796 RepID=UPI001E649DD3|nr:DUF2163 domain-containing protein [Paracoccus sp. MA]UFM64562.1 DUF2163 domain-containing protein [Paracoccus sp. MA]